MQAISRADLKGDASPVAAPYGHARTRAPTERTTSDFQLSVAGRDERAISQARRFVAGATFFNYNAYGSLRPNEEPIRLASRQYFGLTVHVVACGFAFYFFTYAFGRLLAEYLRANDQQQVNAANYVLVWPSALSLCIGLMSDLFTVFHYRRKAYMVLGWLLCLLMSILLIVLDVYSDSGRLLKRPPEFFDSADAKLDTGASPYVASYLLVSLVMAFGIQVSWVSAVAASVEFAQREHIHHRGRLQGTLLALYYMGGVAAQSLTAYVIKDSHVDHVESKLSLGEVASVLAGVSVGVLPFLLFGFHEDPFVNTPRVGMPLGQRLKSFWKFCHHNVVYRVLFFTILHLLIVGQYNQNARDAVQKWSGVSHSDALVVDAARLAANMLSVLIWKTFLRNVNWRTLVIVGSTLYISTYMALTVLTTCDVVRNQWFYGALIMVTEVPRAWLLLYTVVLAAEIADVGHEGVTVGLAISYQTLAGLVDFTLAAKYPEFVGFKVSDEQIAADSDETRANVLKAFFIIFAVNLLNYVVVRLLPQQKLDAQQLRAFGGYNKYASIALAVAFVVMLCFNLAANLMVVL